MRIIDADQAKEIAEVSLGDIFLQTAVKLLLDKTPTIDAVPVVRCKDCKHYEWNPFDGCDVCIHLGRYVHAAFSCIDGERKNNE